MSNGDDLVIRAERPGDHAAIRAVTERAFAPMPYADGDEHALIDRLREAGALTVSLVAERGGGTIIGHVAFSPAVAADGEPGWFALGPVAVAPEEQRRGIARRLIEQGLGRLEAQDARGCILVGNPAYYARFGFVPAPALAPPDQPAAYYQVLSFTVAPPVAGVAFHPLFGAHAA